MLMSKKGGLRTALLAGACVVALGATAGSASASHSCVAGSGSVVGKGASLQNVAQNSVWIPAYNGSCAGSWQVSTYRGGGSGGALANWGFNGNPFEFNGAGNPLQVNQYIGSDDAPYATTPNPAISTGRGALDTFTSRGAGSSSVVVVPVLQAAVAIIVNPPANCSLPGSPAHIDNVALEQAFDGSATTWSAIGATGAGCSASLTRAVRSDSSGTTYQFKHYLQVIDPSNSPTWASLQTAANNTTWPSGSTIVTGNGNGGVVTAVNANAGSIGYANLADVKAAGSPPAILNVQNDGTGAASHWGDPVDLANGDANCDGAAYAGAYTTSAANQDWSGVYGGNPNANGTRADLYPICALTYDIIAEQDATSTGSLTFGASEQATAKDYLSYVVDATEGQADISGFYYKALPDAGPTGIRAVAEGNVNLGG